MPRIFLFDRSLPLTGGVAHSFLIFGRHRDPARIAVHAVSCQGIEACFAESCAAAGMMAHDIGDGGYLSPGLALRRLLLRFKQDLILCCSLKPYMLAIAAAFGLSTRVVFWHVAITDILDGWLRTRLYRWLARDRDILANSRATEAAGSYASHRGRSRVAYLGVEDAPPAAPPAVPGIPAGACVIAYTASFVEYKKHAVLIEAFAHIAAAYPDAHLLLIGVGPGQKTSMLKAAGTGQGARIHFLGARNDVRSLLGAVDIYVHPAVGEGFGLAVVEAMLAGLPVVAARAGALPEIIDGSGNGLLCAPDNPADLAACITRLVDDGALRAALGAAARQSALARFSPGAYVACLMRVIEELKA
jgi:glycosyltransferase involved in cell wall biosynthesis